MHVPIYFITNPQLATLATITHTGPQVIKLFYQNLLQFKGRNTILVFGLWSCVVNKENYTLLCFKNYTPRFKIVSKQWLGLVVFWIYQLLFKILNKFVSSFPQ